jgi:hypothetical protein
MRPGPWWLNPLWSFGERLVRREQAVATGEQVALEPALAVVLAQHLHHAPVGREVVVVGDARFDPRPVLDLEHRAQPVGVGLVGTEQPEVRLVAVAHEHVAQQRPQLAGRLVQLAAGLLHLERVHEGVRQRQVDGEPAAVGMRVGSHAACALGRERGELGHQPPVAVEELLGSIRPHPLLELRQVVGVGSHAGERHLVGSEGALDAHAVDLLRAGPALGGPQHDRRPGRPPAEPLAPGLVLDGPDRVVAGVQRAGQRLVDRGRIVALDEARVVAVALEQRRDVAVAHATHHRGTRDLVLVEVEDRQHRAVACGVEEAHALPRAFERTGLGFAVADDAGDDEVRVVERRAERVHERVAELAALVDRSGGRHRHVAGHAAGRGELAEEAVHAPLVLRHVGVDLAVRALEVDVGQDRGAAVAGSCDVEHVGSGAADEPVEVHVEQAQAR